MSTVNISLPEQQIKFIDQQTTRYGFANRSEFVRSLLRLVRFQPHIIEQASTFPFVSPKEKSVKKVAQSFKATGKYSKKFLNDLEEGLKSSDYFQP